MANRLIGGILSSKQPQSSGFVSRASTGTYFDNTGVLRTAPINQPRLNYSFVGGAWSQPTVLIEPASTNKVPGSSDFGNVTYWGPNNSTIGTSATTAPDGTTTASKIQETSATSIHGVEQDVGVTNSLFYTLSIFAKAAERSWLIIDNTHQGVQNYRNWFNLSTGVTGTKESGNIHTSMVPVGNGWYRCSVTRPAGTAGSHRVCIYASTGDGTVTYTGTTGSGIYIWGCQLENQFGITSYIPTTTAVVTRAVDITGVVGSGMYTLAQIENQTTTDDQFTVQSFPNVGSNYNWTAPEDVVSVEVLVVAGGGSGEGDLGGGGGGGGVVYNTNYPVVPGTTYPIIVGSGGVATATFGSNTGRNGGNSQFGTITAIGGGSGGYGTAGANTGGSGGGGGQYSGIAIVGAPGVAGQGYSGGNAVSDNYIVGGGGGAGGAGGSGNTTTGGGQGGPGLYFNISGTSTAYAGGGGGAVYNSAIPAGTGGVGGGGNATGTSSTNPGGVGGNGQANTGGGGGGGGVNSASGTGGSGIVIIKFKRTPRQLASTSNAAVVVQKFTTSNIWTVPAGVTQVETLVVAGGGAGGYDRAGGGGAGGVVYSSALTVTPGSTYTIGVGAGGIGGTAYRSNNGQSQSGFGSGIGTGSELITNGNAFTTTTSWSATTATLSVPQTGTFRILPNASVNGSASQTITTVIGTTYVVVVKVTSDVSKQFRLFVGSSQLGQQNATFFTAYTKDSLDNGASGAGFYSVTFTASATTTWIDLQIGGGTQQATDISYISVRQATLSTIGGGYGGDGAGAAAGGGSGGGTGSGAVSSGGSGTAGQGNSGGANGGGTNQGGAGGGGGAGSSGSKGGFSTGTGGNGGAGLPYSITGNLEYYAGGGGGGAAQDFTAPKVSGYGGIGGGGQGGNAPADPGKPGAPNTGGGGGGGSNSTQGAGGNGGSGVVILRYRVPQVAVFQDSGAWTCPSGVTSVQALTVAGGGGGGAGSTGSQLGGGGGGAGGLIYSSSVTVIPGTTYLVVVGQGGGGGITGTSAGTNGQNSSFANLIAIGGGYGGVRGVSETGGSGGSGGAGAGNPVLGGTGTYGQGNNGAGSQIGAFGGGGGGAGAVGSAGQSNTEPTGGSGGTGLQFSISGTATYYAGGGSSGAWGGDQIVPASLGGGGAGGSTRTLGYPGLQNTGGGGGASGSGYRNVSADTAATKNGAPGGSGIVIIRWYGG